MNILTVKKELLEGAGRLERLENQSKAHTAPWSIARAAWNNIDRALEALADTPPPKEEVIYCASCEKWVTKCGQGC